jgi:threonine/homoserine/homoserine lactone efflux protein
MAPHRYRAVAALPEGVTFQLINPKAWMMAITVASAFYGGVV